MKIGLDLDGTVYGFPEFFREFIKAMSAAGHTFYCTSNHRPADWEKDKERLAAIGIDHHLISPELLQDSPGSPQRRAERISQVDIAFDDMADRVQRLTDVPVFKTPIEKAVDSQ